MRKIYFLFSYVVNERELVCAAKEARKAHCNPLWREALSLTSLAHKTHNANFIMVMAIPGELVNLSIINRVF